MKIISLRKYCFIIAAVSIVIIYTQETGAIDIAKLKATQSEALAVYNRGISYEKGDGVPKDFNTAVSCYRKAADMGDHNAQYRLGMFYYRGQNGISKDYKVAADYLLLAAKQCNPEAQYLIGACYLLGNGVSKDEAEAYKWTYLAAMNGCQNAVENKKRMESLLSSSKVEEGKSRAVVFLKGLQTQYGLQ